MRMVATLVGAVVLLAGCGPAGDVDDGESESPTTAAASPSAEPDLGAACDALEQAVALPKAGSVEYSAAFHEPTGWSTNAYICEIEPDGEYYDVAAEAGEFGRAEFNYGVLTDEELQQAGYPEYRPEGAGELLTFDQPEPGDIEPDKSCEADSCGDPLRSYLYTYKFETVVGDIAVVGKLDYITTDQSGDLEDDYREQAIAALNAAMGAIEAELG